MSATAPDTVFDTALHARSLIEASAGTGKTYALAGLFARAVIVERRRVPQILAVTYTVAATEELHERVRLRLQAAAELAAAWQPGDPPERPGDGAEIALLRRLLHQALHDESPPALRLRLARAVREMDLAAITTIHGFCQRLLAEHALAAGRPLLAAELVPANAARRSALAVELWREHARAPASADFLQRSFGDPEGLAAALDKLLAPEPLLPPPPDEAEAARDRAWAELRACWRDTGEAVREALTAAMAGKILSSAKTKAVPLDELWPWFAQQGEAAPRPHPQLRRLSQDWLGAICLRNKRAPQLPLCAAVSDYLRAEEACDLQRLHALRTAARARDAADKRAFHTCDYDDLIAAVYAATADEAVAATLATALAEQYPLVLVDEFQDTDARQWAIFERLFGAGGLLLVGDPKQAIYRFRGGDVETYLRAKRSATAAAPLRRNFRSRPCVLAAVNALFEAAPADALGEDIAFAASEPGGRAADGDLQLDGAPAPALVFHRVPPQADTGKDWNKPESTRLAAQLCAEAIVEWLQQARDDRAHRRGNGGLRPLLARDCAVLVREHREAVAVREALAERGVPAVSVGRGSLFATAQAQSLLTLLLALAAPGDERRLRATLATPLFGFDAAALAALAEDGETQRRWQEDVLAWRERWQRHGPQAMLAEVLARQAPRLLALAEGERELTYLLQLGELMQQARARRLGLQAQLDWLAAAIAHADGNDEAQQPRLESDAGRVQILTLHASKGLEFPLVFLPFSGIGRGNGGKNRFVDYHDETHARVRQWKTEWTHPGAPSWEEASRRAQAEERAEDMRLLYVGLTRAREALWLCGGALAAGGNTALHRLLGGAAPDAAMLRNTGGRLREGLPVDEPQRLPPPPPPLPPAARAPKRPLRRDWWIHSFSQLHRQRPHGVAVLVEDAPAADEHAAPATHDPLAAVPASAGEADAVDPRFRGERFGNALHHALEHADFAAWRDHAAAAAPEGQLEVLQHALREYDYPPADIADGVRELNALVAATLNAPLPERGRLCELAPTARVAELEFHLTLGDADSAALLALLHRHGVVPERRDFGAWPRLSGLLTGKIDLTYRSGGRVYLLDYKSNLLPDYQPATLAAAMRAQEYDLQALLYAVALHRWQRLRSGAGYDYARDFGGVRYLFCRGLARGQSICTPQFDAELIHAIDALLGGNAEARA